MLAAVNVLVDVNCVFPWFLQLWDLAYQEWEIQEQVI